MAAPEVGDAVWNLKSPVGRKKLFSSPEAMRTAATEYFKWCVDNPLMEAKIVDGKLAKLPKMRPFTMHGLCLYLHCDTSYFRIFKAHPRKKKEQFITVIREIEEIVYNNQLTGAAAGFLKENIIARSLGLKDRTDVTSNEKEIVPVTGMVIKK